MNKTKKVCSYWLIMITRYRKITQVLFHEGFSNQNGKMFNPKSIMNLVKQWRFLIFCSDLYLAVLFFFVCLFVVMLILYIWGMNSHYLRDEEKAEQWIKKGGKRFLIFIVFGIVLGGFFGLIAWECHWNNIEHEHESIQQLTDETQEK